MPVNGRLTLEEMRDAIRRGEGILLDGKPITRLEDLPPPEVHMRGDLVQLRETLASLDRQIANLSEQRKRIVAEIDAIAIVPAAQPPADPTVPPAPSVLPAEKKTK